MHLPSEDLLGYLLDALDDPERTRLEGVLAEDAALRRRLEVVRHWVELLEPARQMPDPPLGLAERTCQWIAAVSGGPPNPLARPTPPTGSATEPANAAQVSESANPAPVTASAATVPLVERVNTGPIPEAADGSPVAEPADAESWSAAAEGDMPLPAADVALGSGDQNLPVADLGLAAALRPLVSADRNSRRPIGYGLGGKMWEDFGRLGSRGSGWRWPDLVVAGAVSLLLVLVLFGAIHYSRLRQEITHCQENLRRLGGGLLQYSELHQEQFPAIPTEGPLAVAGMYGPILLSGGFVQDEQAFWCPGAVRQGMVPVPIPNLAQLERIGPAERGHLLSRLGGAYGYSLGYVESGRYWPPRNRHRAYFALLADAPSPEHPACPSFHHGGHGQNVCFEDGHVEFVIGCRLPASSDHLFLNDLGLVAPGIGPEDAVVAPGTARPNLSAASLQSQ